MAEKRANKCPYCIDIYFAYFGHDLISDLVSSHVTMETMGTRRYW